MALAAQANAGGMITGAGSTFVYPILSKWADAYYRETGVKLNYQSIGSGGGIKQIIAGTVDFGASDAPLKPERLAKEGLVQWPVVMGGVVPVVNIPGIKPGALKLSRSALAGIFLGKITRWNDPEIARANPGLKLPDMRITVVHRSDGSGTTWIFTNYLDKISPAWHEQVGFGKAVKWPVGVGGKGNEGVANYVGRIKGAIGYVEFAYALENKMSYAQLETREGTFVAPSIESFQAAAANADWAHAKGFYLVLTDQPGANSWPITGATFVLVHKQAKDPARTKQVLRFFDWCFAHGDAAAKKLAYVPMPANVKDLIRTKLWPTIQDASGKPLWP
ncbi:MAG: phosphate ABC transporter substrate-binding protein PstS [Zetaproteobacteria bacterium]|nr:MAG: phosphate ABC transporter substrate-binding protein PstS [Zetaproteobacteria bacterium]